MDFRQLISELNLSLTDRQYQQFDQYADLLVTWNQKMNLTAITGREDIYIKHFYDCLLILKCHDLHGTLADVGSGAGFPGLVLKIACPDLQVALIEPTGKRCRFLQEVVSQLNLEGVEIINQRSEDYFHSGIRYDYVTARAVSQLNILLELCLPLLKVNGHFIAMKGPKAVDEAIQAEKALKVLGGKISRTDVLDLPDDQHRLLIDIVKYKETPQGYPRNYSQIKKRPL